MLYRGLVFLAAVLVALATGFFVREAERRASADGKFWPGTMELGAQDALTNATPAPKPYEGLVLVAADDKSIEKYGKLPWSREVWAAALRRVEAGDPKVTAFDVALEKRTTKAKDEALWKAMANGRNAVLGMGQDTTQTKWTPDDVRSLRFLEKFAIADNVKLKGTAAVTRFEWPFFDAPVSDFTGSARGVGVFLRETDDDAVIRHARLLYLSDVKTPAALSAPLPGNLPESKLNTMAVVVPSLALEIARQAAGLDKTNIKVEGGQVNLVGSADPAIIAPVDGAARMAIRYCGPAGTIPALSLVDVARGDVKPETFKGKVVLLGITAKDAKETDLRTTPKGEMPRVEITANAASSLLSRNYINRATAWETMGILLGAGVVGGLLLAQKTVGRVLLWGLVLFLAYLLVAGIVLTVSNNLLPVLPVAAVLGIATILAALCTLALRPAERRVPVPPPPVQPV